MASISITWELRWRWQKRQSRYFRRRPRPYLIFWLRYPKPAWYSEPVQFLKDWLYWPAQFLKAWWPLPAGLGFLYYLYRRTSGGS